MNLEGARPVKKPEENHRVTRPRQTGFSSPATHYNEPRIDLNAVLVHNTEATFYIRMIDDTYANLHIHENDVLIVDKSLSPKQNQLAVAVVDGSFQVLIIDQMSRDTMNLWGVVTYIIK